MSLPAASCPNTKASQCSKLGPQETQFVCQPFKCCDKSQQLAAFHYVVLFLPFLKAENSK